MGKESENILDKEVRKEPRETFPELDEEFVKTMEECMEEYDEVLKKLVDR
ncbi:hypothetical protein [Bacillus sp. S0628]|nr:hypothetical protein [Bacillus sp. S0628]MCP1322069.1 hypothetical protein [Bacillus sp. S0628]